MTNDDNQVPPAGEEIHLPPGSMQPIAVTVGFTIALLGATKSIYLVIAGSIILIWALALWIRDARREHNSLPTHHDH